MNNLALFQNVLSLEAKALEEAKKRVREEQLMALEGIYYGLKESGGNLIVCGVGKSGHIGNKIAATFSSLGLPSFFLHPTEALHGDLGRVTNSDALILISKSGTTSEILDLIPYIGISQKRIIALVGNINSPIANESGLVFDCSVQREACLNDLAPTTSTTLTLAVADAMAVFYESLMNISREKFAVNHPGGLLGKSLSLKVERLMLSLKECPVANKEMTFQEGLMLMTQKPVGAIAICEGDKLLGILVEGDIRRALSKDKDILSKKLTEYMNAAPTTISSQSLAFEALKVMENREQPFSILPVVKDEKFLGFIRLHDLFRAGFVQSQGPKTN